MKEYILFFIRSSSILDTVLKTIEPDSDLDLRILGYTVRRRKIAIITIEAQCPISCKIVSIIGTASQIANEQIKTSKQMIEVFKSYPDIARVMLENIKNKILIPKAIFCFLFICSSAFPMFNCSGGTRIVFTTFFILGLINLVITGLQTNQIERMADKYAGIGEFWKEYK